MIEILTNMPEGVTGGPVTLALATSVDHPNPGQVVIGIKTADVDAHERRAVVYDNKGNGIVFYKPLGR